MPDASVGERRCDTATKGGRVLPVRELLEELGNGRRSGTGAIPELDRGTIGQAIYRGTLRIPSRLRTRRCRRKRRDVVNLLATRIEPAQRGGPQQCALYIRTPGRDVFGYLSDQSRYDSASAIRSRRLVLQ